jgi:hypothetical protein
MKKSKQTELVIFTHGREKVKLRGDFDRETLWASQADIAAVFGINIRTVNEHLINIYKTKELDETSTIRNFRIVRIEGKREVTREIIHYNLDAIIAVGYRVGSVVGTRFRQWATKTLRTHITKGYTINPSRIAAHYGQFMEAVETLKKLVAMVIVEPKR